MAGQVTEVTCPVIGRAQPGAAPLQRAHAAESEHCDMAFIEPMHRNKPNITYLLKVFPFHGIII